MILRRIVFGEPKPGFAAFGAVLEKLAESVSYCNRGGPLLHDRVTDLAFTIPALGLDFAHPTELSFVCGHPPDNDPYGIFAYHHMPLYVTGMLADSTLNPLHVECARLCNAIYARPGELEETWDTYQETEGVVWAIKHEVNRAYVVFRGSDTFLDWLRDIAAFDPERLLARITRHDQFGAMWDGFLIGMLEAWAAIKPLIINCPEVIFTGHSLGAARGDVAAGYALLDRL